MSKKKQIDCNEIMEIVCINKIYTYKKRNLKIDIFKCYCDKYIYNKDGKKELTTDFYFQTCYHFKKEKRKEIILEYDLQNCIFNFIKRMCEL